MNMKMYEEIAERFEDAEVHGDEIWANCPMCGDVKRNLWINPKLGLYHCWVCEAKGRVEKLLDQAPSATFIGSVQSPKKQTQIALPPEYTKLDKYAGPPWTYFVSRRFSEKEAEMFGVGYCSRGSFYGRLIIPVWYEQKIVSFVGRDYTGTATTKFKNPGGVLHRSYLYNQDCLNGDTVVLTEGIFDSWRVGASSAVATFGTSLTVHQVLKLCKLPIKTLYFCWDEDAIEKAYKISFFLTQFFNDVRVTELPKDKDPADLAREEVWEYIYRAKSATMKTYVISKLFGRVLPSGA